jgi:hypothetical protein
MTLYALTIFTSAFLLFLVQPIIAKQILPWFGGSAAVWTTCLVFFQLLLVSGYAYADWTTRWLAAKKQAALHIALLALSLASLPIIPDAAWKPAGDEEPAWRILGLLAVTIGLPFFLLSTTGPLVQAWFARTFPTGTVYRLFALSNFGSLLALLSYPFIVEPWITTAYQSQGWSVAYVVFVALCASSAVLNVRSQPVARGAKAATASGDGTSPAPRDYAAWLLLSAMGSFMLLAVTNHITQDVASVPFLWILPLTIYLVTFILCFEGRGWYQRRIFLGPLLVIVGAVAWSLHAEAGVMDIKQAIPLNLAGLFVTCMFFHGELAARKPPPRHLTSFYLMVALGGALGGVAVGLVAAKIFNTYYEYSIGLVVTLLIAAFVTRRMHMAVMMLVIVAISFTGNHVYHYLGMLSKDARVMTRSFYGTLRVEDDGAEADPGAVRRLKHGIIMHGEQFRAKERLQEPTTYYGKNSGVGRMIRTLQSPLGIRVGIVGLGTGTLAAYGRAGDVYRFYEINPQVVDLAWKKFFFLPGSAAKIEIVLGDARLAMEREPPQGYDLLAIDAFSSDSIPVHLLTREALGVYLRHLKPDGAIAFHVTNRFLNLPPVVKRIAAEHRLHATLIAGEAEPESRIDKTEWVVVTRNRALLERPEIETYASDIDDIRGMRAWTDDFNNLFQVLD